MSTRVASLRLTRSWVALVIVVLCLSISGVSRGECGGVRVIPANPTENDSVTIAVDGWLPDSCWRLSGFDCGVPAGGQISFDLYLVDEWTPEILCLAVITPYACQCDYDPLAVGHYVVTLTWHRDSLRDPFPGDQVCVVEFDVAPESPAEKSTWGRIRALYR